MSGAFQRFILGKERLTDPDGDLPKQSETILATDRNRKQRHFTSCAEHRRSRFWCKALFLYNPSLWKHSDRFAVLQQIGGITDAVRVSGISPDRKHAARSQKPSRKLSVTFKQFRFRHKMQRTPKPETKTQGVKITDVIGCQDKCTLRNMFSADIAYPKPRSDKHQTNQAKYTVNNDPSFTPDDVFISLYCIPFFPDLSGLFGKRFLTQFFDLIHNSAAGIAQLCRRTADQTQFFRRKRLSP